MSLASVDWAVTRGSLWYGRCWSGLHSISSEGKFYHSFSQVVLDLLKIQ